MNESELLHRRAKIELSTRPLDGLVIYFLAPGSTIEGVEGTYTGLLFLELLGEDGMPIVISGTPTASSVYGAGFEPINALQANNRTWVSNINNGGNPDKSCWWRLALDRVHMVHKLTIAMHRSNVCRHVRIETLNGELLYDKSIVEKPYYPTVTVNGAYAARIDLVF